MTQFFNKSTLPDADRFCYPDSFVTSLTHKDCSVDTAAEHLYEDDMRHTDIDELLFDHKTTGVQVTHNEPLNKIYDPHENAVSRENGPDPLIQQTAGMDRTSTEKLDSTELNTSLTTSACGDISKQRST
ncbi:unnamed protein product [Echinostoma caproni]|uniref:Uncharacterized protein n=1 Tax=Echinostoma caproni TaxID=27848 RepID=A0A183AWY7_9TREM|nr:unnamed protein product [Echinostoma caproni]